MYENLRAIVGEALNDLKVRAAQSAMIYKDGEEFSYEPFPIEEYHLEAGGNEFIRVTIMKGERPYWHAWCREAIQNEPYIAALINGELIESDEEN